MSNYVDVLLPIPLKQAFTYAVNESEALFLKKGMRVSVPFGKRKLYAGLVISVHKEKPDLYDAKEIDSILDEVPLVLESQLALWKWMAKYYMCTHGELLKSALPSALLLEGETVITKVKDIETDIATLKDDEFLVYEALEFKSSLKIQELSKILGKKTVLPVAYRLLEKKLIIIEEYVVEKYTPKLTKWVRLHPSIDKDGIPQLLDQLKNAQKQRELVLQFFTLRATQSKISTKDLLDKAKASLTSIKSLEKKEIFEVYEEQTDRVNFSKDQQSTNVQLNSHQQIAFQQIKQAFESKNVCLLHGVTASGKTEIYSKLIQEVLDKKQQVLFLVPEISLTTQLIERLKIVFGIYLVVYHSRFSANERVEAWHRVLNSKEKPLLIIGVRSSVFLPFSNLGLVIVDEEHEQTYKQYDPAPRYHARDTSIVLAHSFKAKVLLGSATPSVETYYNAKEGKYGLVVLNKRHSNVQLPDIELIDLQKKYTKRQMKGHFSDRLLEGIQESIDAGEQVILFQNRRGYSSTQNCLTCGYVPQCTQCDVSLTYHKHTKHLRCHYCGYQIAEQLACRACGSTNITTKGLGTEQVELELKELFPKVKIARMDQDTTRGKFGHQKIIAQFENQEVSILVGTQMLAKGLDFKKVSLVGVMNADGLLFFPDYRAHEHTYQLLSQVSGRSGRSAKRGKVMIQTFNPLHQILQQVSVNDYVGMFNDQLQERKQYKYPPFNKLIKLTLRHKDFNKTNEAADWLAKALKASFKENVLGPEFPAVSRIRNQFNKNVLLKIPPGQSLSITKDYVTKLIKTLESIRNYNGVRVIVNVDTI